MSFILNVLSLKKFRSSNEASAWSVRWPAVCIILHEVDYLFHNQIPPPPPLDSSDKLFVQTLTFPVSGATTGSLLWQGAQVFGFIFVIVMDAFRDPNGTPENSMSRSLIFEAAIAGVIMLLSFLFNGQMKQSETAKWSKSSSQNVEGYADKITSALPVVVTDAAVLLDLSEANESKQSVLETEEVGFSKDTR
ncbi:hypothetical protein G6F61_002475 [Rhizopus arrhizus]|nr:hypothetical protein G6F61_002475 [Rhizopus arrhizus]